jgi:hypothetical protein
MGDNARGGGCKNDLGSGELDDARKMGLSKIAFVSVGVGGA